MEILSSGYIGVLISMANMHTNIAHRLRQGFKTYGCFTHYLPRIVYLMAGAVNRANLNFTKKTFAIFSQKPQLDLSEF